MTNDFRHNKVDDKNVPDDVKKFEAGVVAGMGEGGAAVQLKGKEKEEVAAIEKRWAFNKIASDKVSLWRRLNDIRGGECQKLVYDDDLPSTSVIIIFNNEALSALLRTVWSVIDNTPRELLHEVRFD